jgi:hypothetical protein
MMKKNMTGFSTPRRNNFITNKKRGAGVDSYL